MVNLKVYITKKLSLKIINLLNYLLILTQARVFHSLYRHKTEDNKKRRRAKRLQRTAGAGDSLRLLGQRTPGPDRRRCVGNRSQPTSPPCVFLRQSRITLTIHRRNVHHCTAKALQSCLGNNIATLAYNIVVTDILQPKR